MTKPINIAVLGAGSWGTALAFALARNNNQVTLWGHRKEHIDAMSIDNSNVRYLEGFSFPDNLRVTSDLAETVKTHTVFLIVTPSHAFRQTLKDLSNNGLQEGSTIAWATKGFDAGLNDNGPTLLSNVVLEELGENYNKAIVSGPSFSKEVAANLPTAITSAGDNDEIAFKVAELFHGGQLRAYTNPDFIGVQVGGAVKNVMAIAAGISDGLGYGSNSRCAIITRGLAEVSRLGNSLGANNETFQGLAGMGDLVLTCTDNQSRNRRFGLGIGEGKSTAEMLSEIGQEVEGLNTTKEVYRLAQKRNVEMPICEQVYKVLYEGLSPLDAVNDLLSRSLVIE